MEEELSGVKVEIEEKNQVERLLKIQVPRSIAENKYNKLISKAIREVNIKGFRPGRAPRAVVEKLYGATLMGEVTGEIFAPIVNDKIKENGWKVIGQPKVENSANTESDPLEMKVLLYLSPEPTISNWEGIELNVDVEEYRPEDVEHQIFHLRQKLGTHVDVEDRDIVQKGDFLEILFTLTVDGVVKQASEENPYLLELTCKHSEPDDLSCYFEGRKVGEEFVFNHTFSDNFSADLDLRGKVGEFSVKLLRIKRLELAPLDEDFLKKVEFDGNLEELRAHMEKQEQNRVESANSKAFESALFSKLIELNPFDVPEPLVEHYTHIILGEIGVAKKDSPISKEEFARYLEYFRGGATYRAKSSIILDRLIEANSWQISDDEYDSQLEDLALSAGVSKEVFRSVLDGRKLLDMHREAMNSERALKLIREKVVVHNNPRPQQACSCGQS